MVSNIENSDSQNDTNNTEPNEYNVVLTIIKVVIVAVFLLPLADYLIRTKISDKVTEINPIENVTIETAEVNVETTTEILNTKKFTGTIEKVKKDSYKLELFRKILKKIVDKKYEICTPNDFYDLNKHNILANREVQKNLRKENTGRKEEPVPPIVNYAVGAILIVSLAAALLELYKAKRQPVKKDGKNSLSRKCSLADLTVMKHNRKEMLRRDSIFEVPEENIYSKQLGHKPAPFHRQYSFPVGPSSLPIMGTTNPKLPISSRRLSIQTTTRYVQVVEGRPAAVLQGRRHSIISDGRHPLIAVEGDRNRGSGFLADMTVDDSLERRYHGHGRRVHRH